MSTWQRPGQPRDRVPEVLTRLVHVPVGVLHDVGVGADLESAEHDELRFVWLSGGVSGVDGLTLEENGGRG
jgi:hypothetical protein